MTARPKNSLELVEMVMLVEEIFGTEIPEDDPQNIGSPSEMVDRLEPWVSNQRPNKLASTLLRKLAKAQQRPELAEGLEGHGGETKLPPSFAKFSANGSSGGERF
jgi:hypothetical protein